MSPEEETPLGRAPGERRSETVRCPVCLHEYALGETSRHHAVPKSRGGRETVRLCKPCHKQIHALFTEKELEREFPTVEALLEAEPMAPWVRWIRKRKPTSNVRARRSARARGIKKRRRR
jgi:hypothetical protein